MRLTLDVHAPVALSEHPAHQLHAGDVVRLSLGSAEPIVIARELPHWVTSSLILPLEGAAITLREPALSARLRASLRGWRVG